MSHLKSILQRLSAVVVALAAAGSALAAPVSGAIFTTLADGTRVNSNIYSAKCDEFGVYLDGGPGDNAPQTAAGLPDGDYFFQVTDPAGKNLLSTDPQKYRRFTVTGGIITARSVTPQNPGDHDVGTDADHGAKTIELCPFLDTPNPGGEYKVWATLVSDFVGNPEIADNGYNPGYFHGFIPAQSKTDNFKVKARRSACLTIIKFLDNGNGVREAGEIDLNWLMTIKDPLGATIGPFYTGTDDTKNPKLEICALNQGDYTVTEDASSPVGGEYAVTANILDNKSIAPPSRTVVVKIGTSDRTLIFGNTPVKAPPPPK